MQELWKMEVKWGEKSGSGKKTRKADRILFLKAPEGLLGEEVEDTKVLPEHFFLPKAVREGIGAKIQVGISHFHWDQSLPWQEIRNPGRKSWILCSSGICNEDGGGFSFQLSPGSILTFGHQQGNGKAAENPFITPIL